MPAGSFRSDLDGNVRYWWANRAAWSVRTWLGTVAVLLLASGGLLLAAYQLPVQAHIATDGLGDQPFIGTTEMQRQAATTAGLAYTDELDANGGRYRWTRGRTIITLPALGAGRAYDVTISAAGWPNDVLRSDLKQPWVHVLANGRPVGVWSPTPAVGAYRLRIPALAVPDLTLDLLLSASPTLSPLLTETATFTGTVQYPNDDRPHGLRLYGISLAQSGGGLVVPPLGVLAQSVAALAVLLLAIGPRRRNLGRWLVAAAVLLLGLMLVVGWQRVWIAPLLGGLLPLLLLLVLWRWREPLGRWLARWRDRTLASRALDWGLLVAALGGLTLLVGPRLLVATRTFLPQVRRFDPSAIITLSLFGTVLLLLVLRWNDINHALERFNRRLRTRPRLGWLLLSAIVVIWLGYGWTVIRATPFLGNADYSDNGVVARNLVAGRGWVVDYVSQFYRLNPGGSVARVQETWPLGQPVWIAPFFAVFGANAWAAKMPNLVFFALLSWLVYTIATKLWDRRVGLVAVLLVLINKHMFRLLIFSTADLGFVVMYVAAVWLLFKSQGSGVRNQGSGIGSRFLSINFRPPTPDRRLLLLSGVVVGLMCWQKTSAVVVAVGMGLWVLWRVFHQPKATWRAALVRYVVWWVLPALLVFSPFIVRNISEFGVPVFSTESYDAWVLEYQGTSSGDFENIYKIYTNEAGLPGTNGLPEPSWIKRWGYQRTITKISNQFGAVRDYLLPASAALGPLSGKGNLMGNLDNGSTDPRRWLMAGALLALVGALTVRRRQASLLALVVWSFAPYTIFLATYWHANEERYFVPLIPFGALLASAAIWAIHDGLARVGGGRGRPLALVVAGTLVVLALQPGWVEARDKTSTAPGSLVADWQADIAAFEWLRDNTPPASVVMTRVPWQLNFHAERPAVMNPNTRDLTTLLQIARYYNARYLLVNAITNNKDEAAIALGDLLRGRETANFKQVASFPAPKNRTLYIYEFPSDYNDVPALEIMGVDDGTR